MPSKSARRKGRQSLKSRPSKNSKNIKLALASLFLIIFVLVFGSIFNFINSFFIPLGISDKNNAAFDGESSLNFIVKTQNLSLVNFNPKEGKVTILEIPDETNLEVPGGFGNWQARAVYDLGESTKKGSGAKLLKNTIALNFGLPVDGFIAADNSIKDAKELIEDLRKNPFAFIALISRIKTDFSLIEVIKLNLGLGKVRFDKVYTLNLIDLNAYEEQNLGDGTRVYVLDPIRLDSVLEGFADPKIKDEHLSIAILNAADYPLLAQKVKRVITNLGGNVIITSNALKKEGKSYISGGKSYTFNRLKGIFNLCEVGKDCGNINLSDFDSSARAQITVILGSSAIKDF